MFQNSQTSGGGGGLFGGNKPAGSGLFSGTQGGGGGGGLFGNQQQTQQTGTSGGLFGNQQQQQQQGSSGGLFGNQQQKPGGLFGNTQQGTGSGLFSGQGGGGGGGLFGQQKPGGTTLGTGTGSLFSGTQGGGGGLFNKPAAGGGGGLFSSTTGTAAAGSQFSLFPGQRPGVGQAGSMFPGSMDLLASRNRQNKQNFQLSVTNPIRDKKVGALGEKPRQFIELVSKTLNTNERQIETLRIVNEDIVKKKTDLADITYSFSQDAKQLYMKINQARYIVDDMKSSLNTYEDITTKNFDVCLDLLKGGRLPRLDMPSNFLINITEYFDLRIRELKDKIGEIEELIKLTDPNEDSEEYEKIVMVIDELYNYYLNVAHKVFQLNEYVASFKAQFIDYFKSQGSREVERIFVSRTPISEKIDILGRLETISNYVLENKAKKAKEQEDIAKSLTKQGQRF